MATWKKLAFSDDLVASSITFTPYGNISSTTVQAAIQEVDNEKAAKTQTAYLIDLANAALSEGAL